MILEELTTFKIAEQNIKAMRAGINYHKQNFEDPDDTGGEVLYLHMPQGAEYAKGFGQSESLFERCNEYSQYDIDLTEEEVLKLVFSRGLEVNLGITYFKKPVEILRGVWRRRSHDGIYLVPHQCVNNWVIKDVMSRPELREELTNMLEEGRTQNPLLVERKVKYSVDMAGATDTWDRSEYIVRKFRGHPDGRGQLIFATGGDSIPPYAENGSRTSNDIIYRPDSSMIDKLLNHGIIP